MVTPISQNGSVDGIRESKAWFYRENHGNDMEHRVPRHGKQNEECMFWVGTTTWKSNGHNVGNVEAQAHVF